ncbi:hypothetical protein [Streptomyces sp. LMG1-1-1.1]|uniref:hypothetical protein n=1 Tax=Streptomyces sp. LMG1-1-1.1 TaxID=3135245 RepID=UPI00346543C9
MDHMIALNHPRGPADYRLRRPRTERIDLLCLHRVDETVPLADQAGALPVTDERFARLDEEVAAASGS